MIDVGNFGAKVMLDHDLDPSDPLFSKLMADPRWVAERKYDGRRAVLVCKDGAMTWSGRNGQPFALKSTGSQAKIARVLSVYADQLDGVRLDCELMRDGPLVVFDCTMLPRHLQETSLLEDPSWARRSTLVRAIVGSINHPWITAPELAMTATAKLELWERTNAMGYEGIMLKRSDSPYVHGRSRHWYKVKVTSTADLVVLERDETSCRLGTFRNGKLVEVCGAGVKAAMNDQVKVGTVVEIRYLYAQDHLVQPRMERVRDDKTIEDLTPWSDMRKVRR